jgi:hypothetical protein
MKILVVTGRNHTMTNRGIDIIIDYLKEEHHDIDIYIYPISISNKKVINNRVNDHIYAKYSPINYYEKLMKYLPYKLTKLLFEYIYNITSTINFNIYDLIIIESGYGIPLISKIPGDKKIVYRQSDSMELIITKNKFLIECEKELIRRAKITLVPNNRIFCYYLNKGVKNIKLWENGFRRSPINSRLNNPYKSGSINGFYMGLYPIDIKLLDFLANHHKDIDFHIIGPHKNITKSKNIHYYGYLGLKDYSRYLQYSDFSIIPIKNVRKLDYIGALVRYSNFFIIKNQ